MVWLYFIQYKIFYHLIQGGRIGICLLIEIIQKDEGISIITISEKNESPLDKRTKNRSHVIGMISWISRYSKYKVIILTVRGS